MKAENRVTLHCRKHIVGKVYDDFRVVVSKADEENAKREFERQGYTVTSL